MDNVQIRALDMKLGSYALPGCGHGRCARRWLELLRLCQCFKYRMLLPILHDAHHIGSFTANPGGRGYRLPDGPGSGAKGSRSMAPSELAAYAHEAPTMPEPTTISRNSPHPYHARRTRQQQRFLSTQ